MISALEIQQKSAEWGLRVDAVEKDYVISWLLWGLFHQSNVTRNLAFKGGTALRKVYFPTYRFSEDLDFTIMGPISQGELEACLKDALSAAWRLSGVEFNLVVLRQTRDEESGDAYESRIEYFGPIQRRRSNPPRVRLDLSAYELVVQTPSPRLLIHTYSDHLQVYIPTYTLEEILAEKFRALLRRTRARDLYDIWFLLKYHRESLSLPTVAKLFREKRIFKGLPFTSPDDFWTPHHQGAFAASWDTSLGYQVRDLPPFDEVAREFPVLANTVGLW